jgi:exodeoxyribonuclease VII small subunit
MEPVVAKKAVKKKTATVDFEAALKELENLVEEMEHGEITLEQSLKNFERGIELTRTCQKALQDAEQKVQILTQQGGEETLEDFSTDSEQA